MVLNFACSYCDKIFETITDFYNHAETHDGVTQSSLYGGGNMYDETAVDFDCGSCDKIFENIMDLNNHAATHYGVTQSSHCGAHKWKPRKLNYQSQVSI